MRNTDKVKFIGFSNGGKGSTGYKVRFAVDQVRRTKVLQTIGCTDITWYSLPHDMTKAEAVQYLQNTNNVTEKVYQDAMAHAASRLIGKVTSSK
jgi:hypothetical protein